MKGILHVIVGTPDSSRRSTLAHAVNPTDKNPSSHFLFPHELESTELPVSNWEWIDHEIEIKNLEEENINEWFLFFSNQIDLADQFESVQKFLDQEEELEIGRIITFINSEYLNDSKDQLLDWIDGCAHFSDVFCFSKRTNKNSQSISSIIDRYKTMRYPMETFILPKSKDPPIDKILSPVSRRMTHIFDPLDVLDTEETPENDPFLVRQPNGNRMKPIVIPSW